MSLRVGVGDLDLTELLNPAATAAPLQVASSFSLLLRPLIFPPPPAPSDSIGPQKVIPGARLLLLGLMGTLGEVGQLLGPSEVTITEGIATLCSARPRYGLPSAGNATAASCWRRRSRACFSLRRRNTRIKTTRMMMRSKQASSGRMMRRGSEAGRGRTST